MRNLTRPLTLALGALTAAARGHRRLRADIERRPLRRPAPWLPGAVSSGAL